MNLGNNAYKPISFWSWNGNMREEEIRWQISEFKDKGFGGFFIHSRAGLLTEYLSKDWFRACAIAIDEAKKQGLDAWLYDEDGWPSGFAGGRVNGCGDDYCAKMLRFSVGQPDWEGTHIIAVYRKAIDGTYCKIKSNEGNEEDLYCFYQVVPHYVDIMDKNIIAKFIEITHEAYKKHFGKYFGNVVRGIFTDEPQMPSSPCWSLCMEEKYLEKYGEDILEELWMMHIEAPGYEKFRYRYWGCANELIKENFTGQINDWCEKNHLWLTGHFSSEDGLCEQTLTSGGVMPLYENMGIPAIDHLGNRMASPVLMKQITSVAHQKGIPYIISESFGCAGWDVSFKELLGIAGWQAVFGVNTICTHLSAYTITGRRKRDYPAFFSYQEPWWKDNGILFEAIRKLNYEISQSTRNTKVGVIHPIRSVWCTCAERHRYDAKFLSAEFRELINNLLDIHIDFDLVDEGQIEAIASSYEILIVPEVLTLSSETVEVLEQGADAGKKVIFMNGRPASVEGDWNHALVQKIKEIPAVELQNTRSILQKYFRAYPVQDEFRLFDLRLENEVTGLVSHYGTTETGATAYVFNPKSGHTVQAILRHKGRCRIKSVSLTQDKKEDVAGICNGDYTYATINVEAGTGVLLHIVQEEVEKKSCEASYGIETLEIEEVNPLENNCITLDMGRFCIDDGPFSERKAIIHMLDEIYSKISGSEKDSRVCVEYTFDADFEKIPYQMMMAVEKIDDLEITLNGKPVKDELGWWIDKGICKFDISGMLLNGTNTVLLTYNIPATKEVNDLAGKFESERNRFFYKVEPESIYICGEFDVRCNVEVKEYPTYHSAHVTAKEQPTFTLTDATRKKVGDLTRQDMWFYRGDCEYVSHFAYDGESKCLISVDAIKDIYTRVYVNEKDVGVIVNDAEEIDITQFLQKGFNEIVVVVAGHNRNLLGPHHHIRGELYFVGQHTYMGVKGFEDFVSTDVIDECTWTDDYSFAPFGIRRIKMKKINKQ